jgi:Protein of unknown function (DUF1573)
LSFFVGVSLDFGCYCLYGPGLWHPTIACDQTLKDLGKLSGDKPMPCDFRIRNSGNRSLVIRKVTAGCGGCISIVDFPKRPLLPKQEGVVHAMLLVRNLKTGRAKKTLAVFSNDPRQPALVLRVEADIVKAPDAKEKTVNHEDRKDRMQGKGGV